MTSFTGSPKEIGEQIGNYYLSKGVITVSVEIDQALYQEQLAAYEKYYPEVIEELANTAKALGVEKDQYIYPSICAELAWYRKGFTSSPGCTIFGTKKGGRLYVGRNYDWNVAATDSFEIYQMAPRGRYRSLQISDMAIDDKSDVENHNLFFYPEDAINEMGLYIGLTFAYYNQTNYGISNGHLLRKVAEECGTVAEAIELLKRTPACCPKNFFIADAKGDMAIVETTSDPNQAAIIRPSDAILVKTNHYLDKNLAQEDTVLKIVPHTTSFKRYRQATLQLKNTSIPDQKKILEILNNPKGDIVQSQPYMTTIWSLTLDMQNKSYRLCSKPTLSSAKEITLDI